MVTYIVIIFVVIIFAVWIMWGIKQLARGARRINEEMEIERNKEPDPNVVMADSTSAIARNILIGLIAFAFINGVLYISQEIYHRADVNKCKDLARQLEQMKEVIENYKEEAYKNAVTYDKAITNIEESKRLVEEYNLVVEDYNRIAERAYTRWYIIPLPGARGKAFSPIH